MEEIVRLIVAELPEPETSLSSPLESPMSSAARHTLYALCQTSTRFFHPAARILWRTVKNAELLLHVLYADFPDGPLEMSPAEARLWRYRQERRSRCTKLVSEFNMASRSTKMNLLELTLDIPSIIHVPSSILRGFGNLRHVDVRMVITSPHLGNSIPLVSEHSVLDVIHVEKLELLWTEGSDAQALLEEITLENLRELAVTTAEDPSVQFLHELGFLAEKTSINLTVIDILSVQSRWVQISNTNFLSFLNPLLCRRHLRHVTIVLTGYRFTFLPDDLEAVAKAWPELRELSLSFELLRYDILPNLQDDIPRIVHTCPLLELLHIPGIAAYPGSGTLALPFCHTSRLRHMSSDVAILQRNLLDIAFALQDAFPELTQLGSPDSDEVHWNEVHALLWALKNGDYELILEHLLRYLRAGVYVELP
ncbi:hypothetical protein TRAPUB_3573 [Trametes pubescens]|uniref:F-box domain-containing protein n=1 Tax=Trametes pubescens TaxID=154538 RepID=A0A1M2VDJ4_TRAPU|nr:hypothetical protein TRAPUB_3573 [Trametes pubescens]